MIKICRSFERKVTKNHDSNQAKAHRGKTPGKKENVWESVREKTRLKAFISEQLCTFDCVALGIPKGDACYQRDARKYFHSKKQKKNGLTFCFSLTYLLAMRKMKNRGPYKPYAIIDKFSFEATIGELKIGTPL